MLRQYQLHGGIRRLRPQFDQSKRFGTTSTMATSTAPTPWNRLPPSIDNFRWWDNIFLNFSSPLTTNKTPKIHRKRFLAEPHHGKTHKLLVPALKESFPYLFSSYKKVQVDGTLKHLISTNHKTHITTASAASVAISSRTAMSTTPYSTNTLYLLRWESISYPSNRPSIRTIVRKIERLNYLVEVHQFPRGARFQSFPFKFSHLVILYIVPFPPTPKLKSVPGLTKIKVDRALRRAIHGISTGVALKLSTSP
jgi:hypothetical protein